MSDFNILYNFAYKKAQKMGDKYIKLLEFEASEIQKQGAEQYWIDIIKSKKKFSTNKNLLVLPFLLNITSIDPINDERIQARFDGKLDINKDPGTFKDKDMPDIDLDFIDDARDVSIEYAAEKYGSLNTGLWKS